MACEPWPYDITCLPAGWPQDPDDTLAERLAAMTPAQRSSYDFAVEMLAGLTLDQFGLCEVTARPCSLRCAVYVGGFSRLAGGWFTPILAGGQVYNGCGCRQPAGCQCGTAASRVRLDGPVTAILEVDVAGTTIDPGTYRIEDGRWLVRLDGEWPLYQDLCAPPGAPDTFTVTYQRGIPVPVGGQIALSTLMVELGKARCGDQSCRLPSRVTNIVREGVTYSLLDDPTGLLDAGRTGIPAVDMWLSSINPRGTRSRMAVYSPDLHRVR